MKRILPIFLTSVFATLFLFVVVPVFAQTPGPGLNAGQAENLDDKWIIDSEVTSIGKNASRSGLLLDWALRDYNWSYTNPGTTHPLLPFWVTLRNTVYAILIALVVIAAIVMLVTRGRSLTIQRFIPRFIVVAVLVTFSFSFVQVIYEFVDIFQGFFVRPNGIPLSQKDLLFIGWNYQPFVGLRLLGDANYEAAFTTLMFVKLTTFTYYVMVGILLVRKVILWFFIIISPFFPLLLFFYPLRNTAKIWIGEFFRWLLYAPLFAIFLAALVSLWRIGIPLSFNFGTVNSPGSIIFPTAVSILLGGPGQAVNRLNNLNIVDTYAQYIVALMMLWGVIIIPWILLQIFLDYFSNFNAQSAPLAKFLAPYLNKPLTPPGGSPPPIPPGQGGTGLARTIPIIKDFQIPTITGLTKPIPTGATVNVAEMTKLSIPTIRDIARYESQAISNSEKTRQETQRVRETLTKIANPAQITTQNERSEYERIRETLQNQSVKGDKLASSILNAANTYTKTQQTSQTTNIQTIISQLANPQSVHDSVERERLISLKEKVQTAYQQGSPLATTLVNTTNNTKAITNILNQLANPSEDKESMVQTEKLRETILKESNLGNPLATTLLQTIQSLKESTVSTSSLHDLVSPTTVQDSVIREKLTSVMNTLQTEKEQGNSYANEVVTKLEKISQTSNTEEKETLVKEIKESLLQAQNTGNPLASTIMSVLSQVHEAKQLNQSIQNLASPSEITDTKEKETFNTLRESIRSEKEKSNVFATTLSEKLEKVSATTDTQEKEKVISEIRESIISEEKAGNPLAAMILQSVKQSTNNSANTSITNLNTQIQKAQQEGNPLAAQLMTLAEKEKLTDSEVKDIEKKVEVAKQNGDPLGVLLADLMVRRQKALQEDQVAPQTALPTINRIQQVSLDDYEAVKKMWTENYENLEVPGVEGESGRRAWIADDISQITQTIDLLSSTNPERVKEGMEKVSDILPFLLIGGFSQGEISAYLKAKLEAAKGVLTQIEKKESTEETQIARETKTTAQPMHLSASTEVSAPKVETPDVDVDVRIAPSPVTTRVQSSSEMTMPQASESLLRLANITIPTLRNVAQVDKILLSKQEDQNQDIKLMRETLQGIANPHSESDPQKHEYYTRIRESLLKRQKEGDSTAASVLAATEAISSKKTKEELTQYAQIISLLSHLQKGETASHLTEDDIHKLKERISFEASRGNSFASDIEKTLSDPLVLNDPLQAAAIVGEVGQTAQDGDTLAQSLLQLSQSAKTDDAGAYAQSLVRTFSVLQSLSNNSHLSSEEKEKAEIVNEKVKLLAGQGDKAILGLSTILASSVKNGIDLKTIVNAEAYISENNAVLSSKIPELSSFINTHSQGSGLVQIVSALKSTGYTSPDEKKLHEGVQKAHEDPFVKKLLEWSQRLNKEQVEGIALVLRGLDTPESVADKKTGQQMGSLRAELEKQRQINSFANGLLSLSAGYSRGKLSNADIKVLVPSLMRRAFIETIQGNKIAADFQNIVYRNLQEKQDVSIFHRLLSSLSDPSHASKDRISQINSLRSLVISEKQQGNALATSITDVINTLVGSKDKVEVTILQALLQEVVTQRKQGNKLADAIFAEIEHHKQAERLFDLSEILRVLANIDTAPQAERPSYQSVLTSLEDAASRGDATAMSLLSAIEITRKNGIDLAEVRKVFDILTDSPSSAYLQGLFILMDTSILSQTALKELESVLVRVVKGDDSTKHLRDVLSKNADEFTQAILSTGKEIQGDVSLDKKQEILSALRERILSEEVKDNIAAKEIVNQISENKLIERQELLLSLLEEMARPETIQLPEEKEKIDELLKLMQEAKINDPFAQLLVGLLSSLHERPSAIDEKEILALIKDFISEESGKGNQLAKRILSALPTESSAVEEETIRKQVEEETKKGNPIAKLLTTLMQKEKSAATPVVLPAENKTQQVSLEDYESVKRMWIEGYKKLEVPGTSRTREEWLTDEMNHISQTISLLTSTDEIQRTEGMERVSQILPFLLIGGFTQTEVVSYLKAKLEAARTVRQESLEKTEESDTSLPKSVSQDTVTQLKNQKELD